MDNFRWIVLIAVLFVLQFTISSCDQVGDPPPASFPGEALVFANTTKNGVVVSDLKEEAPYALQDFGSDLSVSDVELWSERSLLYTANPRGTTAGAAYKLDLRTGERVKVVSTPGRQLSAIGATHNFQQVFAVGTRNGPPYGAFIAQIDVNAGTVVDTFALESEFGQNITFNRFDVAPNGTWAALLMGRSEQNENEVITYSDRYLVIVDLVEQRVVKEHEVRIFSKGPVFSTDSEAVFISFRTDAETESLYRVGRESLSMERIYQTPDYPEWERSTSSIKLAMLPDGAGVVAYHAMPEDSSAIRLFDTSGNILDEATLSFAVDSDDVALYSDSVLCMVELHRLEDWPTNSTWTGEEHEFTFHLIDLETLSITRSFERTLPNELFHTLEMFIFR